MRGVLSKLAAFAVAVVLTLSTMSHAAAGAEVILVPDGTCLGIEHFPVVPVGNAPSKAIFGFAFAPGVAGSHVMIDVSGASGDVSGDGLVGPDGRVFVDAPLFSYGPHSVEQIMVEDRSGVVGTVEVEVFGDGGSFVVDDNEPLCDPSTLPASQPPATSSTTTSTSSTTTTSSSTTTTTTESPPTSSEPSSTQPGTTSGATGTTSGVTGTTPPGDDDEGGGSILPPILILVGGGVLIGGVFLIMTGKDDDNCDRERENLAAAQRRLEMINESLQEALGDMAEHEAEISDLEADLDGYNKAKGKGSTVDSKVRYYAYGGGRISEGELEAQIEYYEARLRIAREARARDEARVEEWHQKFQAAEQEVREAEEALYRCLGESAAPAAPNPPVPPSTPTAPGPSGPSGPAISEPPKEEESRPECEDGATYTEKGQSEKLDQFVDFAIIVQVAAGTERKVAEAELMSINLAELAANIDAVGGALGARGAGKSIAGGFTGLGAGEYVMGAGRLVRGTAEGAMASGAVDFEVPTSAPEAITEVLEGIAGFGSFVSRKVGEWLKMNQIYEVHMTLFKQTIIAAPHKAWVCEDGSWKCRRIWQYSVGKLVRGGHTTTHSFRLESDSQRHRMDSEIRRLSSRAQWLIRDSVRKRAEFDAKHQPGPCE